MNEMSEMAIPVIAGLLGIIAFFLRQIYSEFRKTRDEIVDIKTQVATVQTRLIDFWANHEKEHQVIEKRLNSHAEELKKIAQKL